MYRKILVATDGSNLSKKAVSQAIGLSQLMGAELGQADGLADSLLGQVRAVGCHKDFSIHDVLR